MQKIRKMVKLRSEKISKRSISNLIKNFKEEYGNESRFISSVVEIVESNPQDYMKIFRRFSYRRLKILSYDRIFFLYHGFVDGKPVGIIVKDGGEFLAEIGELANANLLVKNSAKNIVEWYNKETKNSTNFDEKIWIQFGANH